MLILSQKDKILSESAKYATYLSRMKSEDEETTTLLKEIEALANKTAISLIDMKPTALKSAGTYKKFLVNLNCEAQMEQLVDFMYNIENSNKLLVIERYQISPKSKESSIARCSMSIAKIFMP
jgi:Tfp pilus assembly protein PilO